MGMKVTKKPTYGRRYPKAQPLLTQTKRLLHRFDLQAKKGLGQHFLIDEEVLKLITLAAELAPTDIVIEIGPGLGVLTKELAGQAGWVVTVELDNKLAAILNQTLASFNNVTIINEDILSIDPAALLREQKARFPPAISSPFSYKVVANLPYYITSPVLRHFLEASVKPQAMVQMSLLSISVQFYGEPRIISHVPARCFYPAPEVDSAILQIKLYPQPAVVVTDKEGFFGLVRAGFSASRKQIVNSLAQGLGISKAEVLALLQGARIVPQRRAETLTLDEWAQLWRVFTRGEK